MTEKEKEKDWSSSILVVELYAKMARVGYFLFVVRGFSSEEQLYCMIYNIYCLLFIILIVSGTKCLEWDISCLLFEDSAPRSNFIA